MPSSSLTPPPHHLSNRAEVDASGDDMDVDDELAQLEHEAEEERVRTEEAKKCSEEREKKLKKIRAAKQAKEEAERKRHEAERKAEEERKAREAAERGEAERKARRAREAAEALAKATKAPSSNKVSHGAFTPVADPADNFTAQSSRGHRSLRQCGSGSSECSLLNSRIIDSSVFRRERKRLRRLRSQRQLLIRSPATCAGGWSGFAPRRLRGQAAFLAAQPKLSAPSWGAGNALRQAPGEKLGCQTET
jgi:hypothetical protein